MSVLPVTISTDSMAAIGGIKLVHIVNVCGAAIWDAMGGEYKKRA